MIYSSYDDADAAALALIDKGVTVVFVGLDLPTGKWGVYTNRDALATPIKRYRRQYGYLKYNGENSFAIEVREVISWKRN